MGRGDILFGFDVLMNRVTMLRPWTKVPGSFPEPSMRLLTYIHVLFHLSYRQEERFIRPFAK